MKKTIYWWARLSPLMKLALLVGVLWLLIVAGSVVSFYLLPPEWQGLIVVVSTALTASVTLLTALISSRKKLAEPRISPAKEGELLIVVAKFRGPESPDPQMYIARRLEADLLMHPALADKVRVSRCPEVIEEESREAEIERARVLGETYGATLVIWGEHDGHSAAPHYLVTRERERVKTVVELEPRAATADLNQFVMYICEELPETVTYLSLFTIGQMYYFADDYSKSLSLFSAALDHFPSGEAYHESAVALHFYRGDTYRSLGKHGLAIADYDRVIELRPDYADAYNNRGNAYYDKDEYGQAITDYRKAIELKADHAEAYYNRGFAYANLGQYALAVADFDKAIELRPDWIGLDPGIALAYVYSGLVYAKQGEYDLAVADFTKAIEWNPSLLTAYHNRGAAYYYKDEYDMAIADFNKAIWLEPNDAGAYSNRGLAYGGKGEYDLAIADFTKAIELRPDDAEAYFDRGTAYADKGEYDLAIADFDRAVELKPDYAEAYYNRGLAHEMRGEKEEAIRDWTLDK